MNEELDRGLERQREQCAREKREDEAKSQRGAKENAVIGTAAAIEARLKRTGAWHAVAELAAEFGENTAAAIEELERHGRIERDDERIRIEQRPGPT
jgi:predicted flap endonuclease-1-like 5' DNA nuclease